jgi:hypothetical protein
MRTNLIRVITAALIAATLLMAALAPYGPPGIN